MISLSIPQEHDLLGLSELMPMYEEGGEVQSLGPVSKCGSIEAAFSLDALSHRINVAIVQARNVPPRNRSSQTLSQVTLDPNQIDLRSLMHK